MSHPRINNGRARREARQTAAAARAEARASLTPAGQIERLDRVLGVGIGAKKERRRLVRPETVKKAGRHV